MNLKKVIVLNKRDRIGLFIFLLLGISIQVFLYLDSLRKFRNAEKVLIHGLSIISVDTVPYRAENIKYSKQLKPHDRLPNTPRTLRTAAPKIAINPNTADSMGFISLGFRAYTIRNLLAYRRTGAVFRDIQDLTRIYGMDSLKLYSLRDHFIFPKVKDSKAHSININEADSIELKKLIGIGPVLSARTIRYRNALGGFTNVNQILEVYGIDQELLTRNAPHISCSGEVDKLDLNRVNEDILRRHPYIDYKTASSIIRYRKQHGEFESVESLKFIHLMKDSIFKKIEPYCTVKRNN